MEHTFLLLVDDDPDYRVQVKRALRNIGGFEVVEAVDGIDALGKFHANEREFDVVLSDTHMPRMTGPALRAELASLGYKGRFFLMTGLATSAGVGADIIKPMMPEVLRASLAVRLRPRRANKPELTVS